MKKSQLKQIIKECIKESNTTGVNVPSHDVTENISKRTPTVHMFGDEYEFEIVDSTHIRFRKVGTFIGHSAKSNWGIAQHIGQLQTETKENLETLGVIKNGSFVTPNVVNETPTPTTVDTRSPEELRKTWGTTSTQPKTSTPVNIDITKVTDMEVDGIDPHDYPDYSDAYISAASYTDDKGGFRDLTDVELDWLNNEYPELANEKAHDSNQGAGDNYRDYYEDR